MCKPHSQFVLATIIAICSQAQAAQASPPSALLVSPGAEKAVPILDECPTFSWAPLGPSELVEIIVAERSHDDGNRPRYGPVLHATLPGSASSWTPPLEGCLQVGVTYVWMARGHSGEGAGDWSSVNLFSVSSPGGLPVARGPGGPFDRDRGARSKPAAIERIDPDEIASARADWSRVKTYEIAPATAAFQGGDLGPAMTEGLEPGSRSVSLVETPGDLLAPDAGFTGTEPGLVVSGNPGLTLRDTDGDDATIYTDPNQSSSDLFIFSKDNIQLYLDHDNNELGVFAVIGTPGSCQIVAGDLSCSGAKSAVVEIGGEHRKLYAIESPEVWFEDFGTATLDHGSTTVDIDPLFAATISHEEFHVFLTPLGDCSGLYVAEKSSLGFKVQELGGGRSSVSFDYRIVARRLGFEDQRLEVVEGLEGLPSGSTGESVVEGRPPS